jgi:hypothetical protein
MTSATLTSFLLARIEDDETVARAAGSTAVVRITIAAAGHMQRFTPSRTLAECAVKRAIVEYGTGAHTSSPEGYDIVRILATVYANHPDYDESWRP